MSRIFAGDFDLTGEGPTFKPNYLQRKGDRVETHAHQKNHVTWVVRGSILISVQYAEGTARLEVKDANHADWRNRLALIRKGVKHSITALEDNTEFVCVFKESWEEAC